MACGEPYTSLATLCPFAASNPATQDGGTIMNGTLKFEREVELRISDRATVGKIVGATPIKE